jgi:hypothetical protein
VTRWLARYVGGAQNLVPRDQRRGRLGHVVDRHRRRHREFDAQDRVEVIRDHAHPCVDVELAQGERSLAGPLPGELDRDRPQGGQPQGAPAALKGFGCGVHRWSAEQLASVAGAIGTISISPSSLTSKRGLSDIAARLAHPHRSPVTVRVRVLTLLPKTNIRRRLRTAPSEIADCQSLDPAASLTLTMTLTLT